MATKQLGRSALATQTRPGMNVLLGNSSTSISDHRHLQGPHYEPRFRRQLEAIHKLGPMVLGYLVEHLAGGADLRATVAEYAELSGGVICEFGGDQFPVALHSIEGCGQ
jgi:hypothetical protein